MDMSDVISAPEADVAAVRELLGICENCRQLATCALVEIAPRVRIPLCHGCHVEV
jgi:hypothetical protein